jgi:hypothetical protein
MISKPKKKNNYVNNKDLFAELVKYRETPVEKRVISNYIGFCIMQICKNLSMKRNVIGYSYRDEMVDDGIENCVYAVPHFNPEKSNYPFSYFTMVAWRAFIRRIQMEKKQNYIKHKNFSNRFSLEGAASGGTPNEFSHQVIDDFERKLTENKKKSKTGLLALIDEPKKLPIALQGV